MHNAHLDRFTKRNPRGFFVRNCDKCQKEISTTYPSESGKSVYCEECDLVLAGPRGFACLRRVGDVRPLTKIKFSFKIPHL